MIAAVFKGPNEIEIQEIETPRIGPGEVLVKMGANTVCGTDVRILRGEKTKGVVLPAVLGHEMAGHIVEVGRDVRGYEAGVQVVVSPGIPCGRCYACQNDMENMCSDLSLFGYDVPGGLSEYVRVPARAVELGNIFVAHKGLPSEYLALSEPLACCVNQDHGGHRARRGLPGGAFRRALEGHGCTFCVVAGGSGLRAADVQGPQRRAVRGLDGGRGAYSRMGEEGKRRLSVSDLDGNHSQP
jgi:threonine dehydrogenase-like Zn-dependent dehydrogenase